MIESADASGGTDCENTAILRLKTDFLYILVNIFENSFSNSLRYFPRLFILKESFDIYS